jgi:hypothetical protein
LSGGFAAFSVSAVFSWPFLGVLSLVGLGVFGNEGDGLCIHMIPLRTRKSLSLFWIHLTGGVVFSRLGIFGYHLGVSRVHGRNPLLKNGTLSGRVGLGRLGIL